jgi:hypothetical protein
LFDELNIGDELNSTMYAQVCIHAIKHQKKSLFLFLQNNKAFDKAHLHFGRTAKSLLKEMPNGHPFGVFKIMVEEYYIKNKHLEVVDGKAVLGTEYEILFGNILRQSLNLMLVDYIEFLSKLTNYTEYKMRIDLDANRCEPPFSIRGEDYLSIANSLSGDCQTASLYYYILHIKSSQAPLNVMNSLMPSKQKVYLRAMAISS